MSIQFTQYMRPNGRQVPQLIDRPEAIEKKALAVQEAGGRFEVEELMTGAVSITCAYNDADIAHQIVANGPPVLVGVDAVVEEAYLILVKSKEVSS